MKEIKNIELIIYILIFVVTRKKQFAFKLKPY